MPCRVTVIGGGAWGAAFGGAISDACRVCFWDKQNTVAEKTAQATGSAWQPQIRDAAHGGDLLIIAVSSSGFTEVLEQVAQLSPLPPVLWLTKGFVGGSRLLCEAAAELLPENACFGALSGPSFADEVRQRLPAALTLAVNQQRQLQALQHMLHRKMLRVYPHTDLTGVCIGGALKNIIAIAAGISDGLALGANARAAIITRGLAEMSAFNRALGGQPQTMNSIAGVGDLLLTCTSDLSRNRRLGLSLGRGKNAAARHHRRRCRRRRCRLPRRTIAPIGADYHRRAQRSTKKIGAGRSRRNAVVTTAAGLLMRPLGSVCLALWLLVSTPIFSLLALLSSPLPPLSRYRLIAQWSRLLVLAARWLCGIRYRVEGMDNLPPSPCVLLSRHESAWETIAYQIIFPPQSIVLKKELLRIPFFGWGLARMSPIAINRADNRRALRAIGEQGQQRLREGFYVVIFPEGTRLRPGERRPYQPGGAWLAKQAQVSAVPVAVNSGTCWPKNAFLKRPGLITVRIGPPIDCTLPVKEINERARQWIEESDTTTTLINQPDADTMTAARKEKP